MQPEHLIECTDKEKMCKISYCVMFEPWSSSSKKLFLCLHPANKKQTNKNTVQHHEKIKHPPLGNRCVEDSIVKEK